MKKVRIGLIGYGVMGANHASQLFENAIPQAELTAVCEPNQDNLKRAKETCGDRVRYFTDVKDLLAANLMDAVLIATPHFDHPKSAIEAFKAGLHVLIEKPAGAFTKHVREMNAAALSSKKVFGIMFNQRTWGIHQKLHDLIKSGELGSLKRINWTITNWYRTQAYYDSCDWRATWAGEGGGVLLNQCPHNLDLWQWVFGMPKRIRAFCHFGKYHNIEVEDDVTAYLEYADGVTGVLVTSTGEAPGTNRLEIAGDNGKLVMENRQLTYWKNRCGERKWNQTSKDFMKPLESWKCEIPFSEINEDHKGILKNFVSAIVNMTPLLAPGQEGICSLELSNAMLLSTWTDNWVELPMDDDLFYSHFDKRLKTQQA